MDNEITFKEIMFEELYADMLSDFNRYQFVNNDWYPDIIPHLYKQRPDDVHMEYSLY